MPTTIKKLGVKLAKLAAATGFAVLTMGVAQSATLLGEEPDASLIVTVGNLEWVYASPCAGMGLSCDTVSLHHGFGFATDEQWNVSFTSLENLLSAFSTPNQKCASTYFSGAYDHCDFGDVSLGYVWHSPLAPTTSQRNSGSAETFLVRAAVAEVPEPATVALLGLGLLSFAASRRKSAKSKNA